MACEQRNAGGTGCNGLSLLYGNLKERQRAYFSPLRRLPAWCMDQLIDAGRPVGLGGPRISNPDVRRAVQAKPGSPPPHPAAAAQGHELARLRSRLASAWQLDRVVYRGGDRGVESGATHDPRWPTLLFAAGDPDRADLARGFSSCLSAS